MTNSATGLNRWLRDEVFKKKPRRSGVTREQKPNNEKVKFLIRLCFKLSFSPVTAHPNMSARHFFPMTGNPYPTFFSPHPISLSPLITSTFVIPGPISGPPNVISVGLSRFNYDYGWLYGFSYNYHLRLGRRWKACPTKDDYGYTKNCFFHGFWVMQFPFRQQLSEKV